MCRYRTIIRDIIAVEVPKGKSDVYKMAARELGVSLSKLVQIGIEEYIKNHAGEVPTSIEESVKVEEKLTEAELRINENFLKLPKSVQKRFASLIQDFAKYAERKKTPKWREIF